MARRLRIQHPGAWYHVVNRGHREEAIVRDDADRRRFLETLGETCRRAGWRVHAFVLLTDHFHLIVETPQPNLVEGMKWFLGTYTSRFNHRHGVGGHLFTGRYRSQLLDASTPGLRSRAAAYLHLNPLRKREVSDTHSLATFEWSSYASYLGLEANPVEGLVRSSVMSDAGFEETPEGRAALRQHTEHSLGTQPPEVWEEFRSGWLVGSEPFRQEMLDLLESTRTPNSAGELWKESAEHRAERIIQERLAQLGWDEAEMKRRSKTDPGKLAIARELRKETMMTIRWLADRLQLGTRNTLRNALALPPEAHSVFKRSDTTAQKSGEVFSTKTTPTRTRKPSAPPVLQRTPPTEEQDNRFTVEPGWD